LVKNLGYGTGRRKTAVARVYLREGNGAIKVNGKSLQEYFPFELLVKRLLGPLDLTSSKEKLDVLIQVRGGGPAGQADACRHGLARALVAADPSNRPPLRASGMLTRDPRAVERKKYGQAGARRRFQFSKR
jgi:small subunit ribosomal protein S9